MPKKILIIAGEASSDLHGSNLVKAIKSQDPNIEFYGLGGPIMKSAGVDVKFDIASRAFIGIIEVVRHLSYFRNIYNYMVRLIDEDRPSLAILIDYPGFNLRFARELKKKNIPVIYYISPQIWAWGKDRITQIKRLVDKMLVIFKFEKELYDSHGMDCEFVGHPLLEITKPTRDTDETKSTLNLNGNSPIISLLPGSRKNEIKRILPIMLESAHLIKKNMPKTQFILIRSKTISSTYIDKIIGRFSENLGIKIVENDTYNLLNISDLCLVCSGTATLETAIIGKPMIVIYKVGFFSGVLLKNLIKIPYIALVNVVGRRKIVPDFIQNKAKPSLITKSALKILTEKSYADKMREDLNLVKESLLPSCASMRAASIILEFLKKA